MKIYIAGPYAPVGVSLHDAAQLAHRNVMQVVEAFWAIAARGHIPFAPHLSHFLHIHQPEDSPTPPQDFWYQYDMEWLRACDAILMVGDWSKSKGAVKEMEEATARGMKVYLNIDDIGKWDIHATSPL